MERRHRIKRRALKHFTTALQFLTIVTVNKKHAVRDGELATSMVHFPAVGFLIGFLLINADRIFALVVLPQSIGNLLLVAVSVLITRALHVDGLADTFDGIMGGNTPHARLAIMKDSRLGTAGALGIFFVLYAKYLCLNELFNSDKVAALLTAPMLARWSQTLMVFKASYGRENGMGKAFVGHIRAADVVASSAVAVGLCAFVIMRDEVRTAILVILLVFAVVSHTLLARRYLVGKLGGVTGDAIGAVSELNEALVLLIFVLLSGGT